MSKASRTKKARNTASAGSGCVYYIHTGEGYVGAVASRAQAQTIDKHSVLICDEEEVARFPEWGNEIANSYVLNKAVELGFKRINGSAFFERLSTGKAYVYFIEAVGLTRVKIGYSASPESRLKQLTTGSPVTLRIHAKMPGNQAMEREIHSRFSHLKVENEWFHFTNEIAEYIKKNCAEEVA
ncbi:GIY-YIG nuclease family protein [Methylophilus glucosoxydans]|uniref:GIY-YIG nuclease family protein n=1 Tax=Methylophilus glucosoxydans TaxID=752553 RepID=A0ABW3GH30_9PROT